VDQSTAELLLAESGLVRLPPAAPGIVRRRCGTGFTYRDPSGGAVDAAERARIESLAIPPAWTDVWIAPVADSHVLATGVDEAGRKQYLYHPAWRAAADAAKFERLAAFADALPRLRRQVLRDVRSREGLVAQCALLVRLVDLTLIRAGSRCYAETNGTFGATTLLASHVEVVGTTVHLSFPGKGGTEHELSVTDRLLATHLRRLVATLDDDSHLFVDDDGRVVERDTLNEYLEQIVGPFTVKDFRTWGATCSVTARLAAAAPDVDDDVAVREAIADAATALGNTPAVCRASYVAPAVVEAYLDGRLAETWRSSRASRWLSRAERATGRLLVGRPTGASARAGDGAAA
jgi:DNA topoisomerase-1